MAIFMSNNVTFTFNAVDLSEYVRSVTLNNKVDSIETTHMGSTSHEYIAGLSSSSIDIEFNQDFATSKVYATIFSAVGTTKVITLKQNPVAGTTTTSATNPLFTFTVFVDQFNPIEGATGDLAGTSCSWQCTTPVVATTTP